MHRVVISQVILSLTQSVSEKEHVLSKADGQLHQQGWKPRLVRDKGESGFNPVGSSEKCSGIRSRVRSTDYKHWGSPAKESFPRALLLSSIKGRSPSFASYLSFRQSTVEYILRAYDLITKLGTSFSGKLARWIRDFAISPP